MVFCRNTSVPDVVAAVIFCDPPIEIVLQLVSRTIPFAERNAIELMSTVLWRHSPMQCRSGLPMHLQTKTDQSIGELRCALRFRRENA
jgi:hypothetical protein